MNLDSFKCLENELTKNIQAFYKELLKTEFIYNIFKGLDIFFWYYCAGTYTCYVGQY
jgi:hypothetical protein